MSYRGRSRPVQCLTTGQIYESLAAAARAYKVTTPAIRHAVVNETQCRGHYWRWVIPAGEGHTPPPNLPIDRLRRIVLRNDGLAFESLIEAGRAVGRPAAAINTAILRGMPVRGYLFTYAYTPAEFTLGT